MPDIDIPAEGPIVRHCRFDPVAAVVNLIAYLKRLTERDDRRNP